MFADFRPLPLLGNPHVQTVLSTWLRGPEVSLETREHMVPLADGDRLMLHDTTPPDWKPGDRIVLMVHGLGGSHRSPHLQRLAVRFLQYGLRTVRVDLRGTGRGMPLARKSYHGGCSDDLRAAAFEIHRWSPTSPLVLAGISLGGNIVLKLAGEAATDPVPNLEQVVAIAPPIDLTSCARLLAQPRNRLYERHFLYTLLTQLRQRQRFFPELRVVQFPRRVTLRTFDEHYTAPRWGFRDAADYYQRASALPLVPNIAVPTLILTAQDDPFIAVAPFRQLQGPRHVEIHVLPHGGHLGFLGWDGAGGIRWADHRVADWVVRTKS
jgi:predicted alpha/beta-fold hydrolase